MTELWLKIIRCFVFGSHFLSHHAVQAPYNPLLGKPQAPLKAIGCGCWVVNPLWLSVFWLQSFGKNITPDHFSDINGKWFTIVRYWAIRFAYRISLSKADCPSFLIKATVNEDMTPALRTICKAGWGKWSGFVAEMNFISGALHHFITAHLRRPALSYLQKDLATWIWGTGKTALLLCSLMSIQNGITPCYMLFYYGAYGKWLSWILNEEKSNYENFSILHSHFILRAG